MDTQANCPAWQAALDRFRDAYGGDADLSDPQDQAAFLGLVRADAYQDWTRGVVDAFRRRTDELDAEIRELRGRAP